MPPIVAQQLARLDKQGVYPPFLAKLHVLVQRCNDRGFYYWATNGVRTWEEQDALYAIGRTTGRLGHVVTKARGGQSLHNFGVACDFALDADPGRPGLQPDYKTEHYLVLGEEAVRMGLVSGGFWKSDLKDFPHVQLPYKEHGLSLPLLQAAYKKGGMPEVFRLFDHQSW